MVNKILLSDVYPVPGVGTGRTFYQEKLGFGKINVMKLPLAMGECAIVHFDDCDGVNPTGTMYFDGGDTKRTADITKPEVAADLIAIAVLDNPKLMDMVAR